MSEGASSRTWWFFVGAAVVIVGLLLVALTREPVSLDPNTPEGTVQNYLQAVADRDYEGAFNLIHPDWTRGCTSADLAAAVPSGSFGAAISDSETNQDMAFVTVTMREGSTSGPFDAGLSTYPEFFDLENTSGQWLIIGYPWPHFEWRCDGL